MPRRKSAPGDFRVVVGLMAMLALPAWLTLRTVQSPRLLVPVDTNPTPYGYTWSLLLFIIPVLAIGWKVLTLRESASEKRSFWLTVALLIPLGCGLDVAFGMSFFTFQNKAATLGWNVPGYVWGHGFQTAIPVEEFAFYAFGFVAILLAYVWADRVWMKAYSPEEQPLLQRKTDWGRRWSVLGDALIDSRVGPLVVGALLFGLAWWIKRHGPENSRSGIPGYFLFIVATSVVPSAFCFRVAAPLINWRAFGFAFGFIFLISLFWEATLGVPYQWWGYQPAQMMGVFVRAFCDLPLEAVLVWVFANWTTVLVYETILFAFHIGEKRFWRVLFFSDEELHRLRQSA